MGLSAMPRRHAALIGSRDSSLEKLLAEVFAELGFLLDPELRRPDPDVVVAVVGGGDSIRVIDAARLLAGEAPVVALLPLRDERLIQAALRRGADACHTMDGPLGGLRNMVVWLCATAKPVNSTRSAD